MYFVLYETYWHKAVSLSKLKLIKLATAISALEVLCRFL